MSQKGKVAEVASKGAVIIQQVTRGYRACQLTVKVQGEDQAQLLNNTAKPV